MTTQTTTSHVTSTQPTSTQPGTAAVFRKIKLLTGGYLAISALAVGATALMHNHPAEVNSSVWIHGIVVAASAVVALIVATLAARGHRRAAGQLPAVDEGRAGRRRPAHGRRRGAGQQPPGAVPVRRQVNPRRA